MSVQLYVITNIHRLGTIRVFQACGRVVVADLPDPLDHLGPRYSLDIALQDVQNMSI
jgi:hypothetical protein